MWRRRAGWATALIAAALLSTSCARRYGAVAVPHTSARGTNPPMRLQAMRREIIDNRQRLRALEEQLAARDREIAVVRGALETERSDGAAGSETTGSAAPADASAATPSPVGTGTTAPPPAPAAPAVRGDVTAAAPAPIPSAASDGRLASAERRIVDLEGRLQVEVTRRREVEAEMARLLQEASSGPYDRAAGVVEKHLREELASAKEEIADLRLSLTTERRERGELEKRFAALQQQLQRAAAGDGEATSEEIRALKERQRRVLASIQQDLQASQSRQEELRLALEQARGPNSVSLADEIASLRSENSALQLRLDQEHRNNRDLSAKLQLATRVTDLIFKMQGHGGTAAPAAANAAFSE